MSTAQLVHTATWLTLLDLLRWRARSQSERRAYTFLLNGETEEVHITYGELDQRARTSRNVGWTDRSGPRCCRG